MTEQNLKTRVIKTLKYDYPGCFIWKISDRWVSGMPDLLWIYQGVHAFFELKVEKDSPNKFKLQKHIISKINAAGGHAYMVWDVLTARTICRDLLNSKERRAVE
jgi:hypothetical protein